MHRSLLILGLSCTMACHEKSPPEDTGCDGMLTWYDDADGDGYGDADAELVACTMPPGYSSNADDCDDTQAATSPAAYEICDGIDNNCDGVTDEGTAVNAETFYVDSDGDGYGDPDTPTKACEISSGFVADNTDCDDEAEDIHPLAQEACDDLTDADCDGFLDNDSDGDGYSDERCGGSDCEDDNKGIGPEIEEIEHDGIDQNCDGSDGSEIVGSFTLPTTSSEDISLEMYPNLTQLTTTVDCSAPASCRKNGYYHYYDVNRTLLEASPIEEYCDTATEAPMVNDYTHALPTGTLTLRLMAWGASGNTCGTVDFDVHLHE